MNEALLNWNTLREIIETDIRICGTVAEQVPGDRTQIRMEAQAEALRKVLQSMDTLENTPLSAPVPSGTGWPVP